MKQKMLLTIAALLAACSVTAVPNQSLGAYEQKSFSQNTDHVEGNDNTAVTCDIDYDLVDNSHD